MAAGKWYIETGRLNGRRVYRAVRKRDDELFKSQNNLEYAGTWCTDLSAVEAFTQILNRKAEEAGHDAV